MRLRLRLLIVIVVALLRSRIETCSASWISIRVLPNDVDLLHVSNDRYLAYFDLGRNDLVIRIGMLSGMLRLAAHPVVKTLSVRYRHRARLFQSLQLRTRIVCWDHEAVWFEQELFAHERSIALAYCHAALITKAGIARVDDAITAARSTAASPEAPAFVRNLQSLSVQMQLAQREQPCHAT